MRIVLVRLRLIGDVVFTTPVIRAVRLRYPTAHLAYVVEPAAEPIVRRNPHLNEVIVVPRRRGLLRVRDDVAAAFRLRRGGYDIAIDLHGGPRSAWLTWATGAEMRVGYHLPGRRGLYTHVVARPAELRPRHSVRNQFDILAPLGITECAPATDPVEMPDDPEAAADVERRLAQAGIEGWHRLIVVHVSAGNPFRRWPEQHFATLVTRLLENGADRRVILTAGPSDAEAAGRVVALIPSQVAEGRHPLVADWGLTELRALIARAAVYIGGDSGPAHMAATTTTPIVGLLGPTLAERSRPWRDPRWFDEMVDAGPLSCRPCHQRRCEPGDFRCLTRIEPVMVAAAAERALDVERHPS